MRAMDIAASRHRQQQHHQNNIHNQQCGNHADAALALQQGVKLDSTPVNVATSLGIAKDGSGVFMPLLAQPHQQQQYLQQQQSLNQQLQFQQQQQLLQQQQQQHLLMASAMLPSAAATPGAPALPPNAIVMDAASYNNFLLSLIQMSTVPSAPVAATPQSDPNALAAALQQSMLLQQQQQQQQQWMKAQDPAMAAAMAAIQDQQQQQQAAIAFATAFQFMQQQPALDMQQQQIQQQQQLFQQQQQQQQQQQIPAFTFPTYATPINTVPTQQQQDLAALLNDNSSKTDLTNVPSLDMELSSLLNLPAPAPTVPSQPTANTPTPNQPTTALPERFFEAIGSFFDFLGPQSPQQNDLAFPEIIADATVPIVPSSTVNEQSWDAELFGEDSKFQKRTSSLMAVKDEMMKSEEMEAERMLGNPSILPRTSSLKTKVTPPKRQSSMQHLSAGSNLRVPSPSVSPPGSVSPMMGLDMTPPMSPAPAPAPARRILPCPHPGCTKTFTRAYNLQVHQLSHSGEKNHVCGECGIAFARLHDLRRHARCRHSHERPYVCNVEGCGEAFPRADALTRHNRIEHGDNTTSASMEVEA
ncbi:hypothetical protein HDU97_002030 [Phlyctochytrium planicorne]|nr:hypothetical protein HDU97_002030 [Phlyctochytrium planicorne]